MRHLSLLTQLSLVAIVSHIALIGTRMTTSLYALSLHSSEFTVGLLLALFSLFPMIFAVAMGRLIDRIGIAKPMTAGCISMSLGCLLPTLLPSLTILYVATIFIGTGFMAIQVASQHAGGVMSNTENRAFYFGWIALSYSISGFLGPIIAGFLIDHTGFQITYSVFVGFSLLGVILLQFSNLYQVKVALPAPESKHKSGGAFDLLRDPELRRIYLIAILLSAAWDLFVFVIPIQGSRQGFSAATIGLILGSFALATFFIRLASPWIAQRYSEWRVLTTSLIMAVICYALFPFMSQVLSMMALAATLGLALGACQPNLMALIHSASPPGRTAEAVGIRVTIINGCQVILPVAFGGAGATLGLFPIFWTMSVMLGTGVPTAWRKLYPIKL